MRSNRFKPLVWPGALLFAGVAVGGVAETAVGRWQNYPLYGLARPVADLLLIIGGVWLVFALVRVARTRRR